jgi:hypothetical protein
MSDHSPTAPIRFPPLPGDFAAIREIYDRNNEMLDLWRNRKDEYMPGYVMLGRWGEFPDNPVYQGWMEKLAYSPIGDAPDERLVDPRELFPVSEEIKPYLPPNELWRRMEKLRHIRFDAIHLNFNPKRLALDAQDAVLNLIALPEALCDRLLEAMDQAQSTLREPVATSSTTKTAPAHQNAPEAAVTRDVDSGDGPHTQAGNDLSDLVTLDQVASQIGLTKKRIHNRMGETRKSENPPPEATVVASGNNEARYSWTLLRPWLLQNFSRRAPQIPEKYPNLGTVSK